MYVSGGDWDRVVEDVQKGAQLSEPTEAELAEPTRMTITCRDTVRAQRAGVSFLMPTLRAAPQWKLLADCSRERATLC